MSLISIPLWRWCCLWQKQSSPEQDNPPEPQQEKGVLQSQSDSTALAPASSTPVSAEKEDALYVRFTSEFFPEEDYLERPEPAQIAKGVYRYQSGCIYKGEWKEGMRHGYGEMTWTETRGYKGLWVQGWPEGEGTAQLNAGLSFSGHWLQRKYSGLEQLPLIPSFQKWLSAVDDGYSTL